MKKLLRVLLLLVLFFGVMEPVAAVFEERLILFHRNVLLLQDDVRVQGTLHEGTQVVHAERLQDEDLATGQEGSDHFEGRVLRCRTDQYDRSVLDGPQKGILLGLIETVDFIDEEHGGEPAGEDGTAAGFFDDVTDILHTRTDGGKGEEIPRKGAGDDVGQRRLSDTGRSPEDKGGEIAALDHFPEDTAGPDKVLLTDIIVQCFRPHPLRKGREGGRAPILKRISHFIYNYLIIKLSNKNITIGNNIVMPVFSHI